MKARLLLCTISLFLITFIPVLSQNTKGDIDLSIFASPLSSYGSDDVGLIGIFGAEFFVFDRASVSANFVTSNNTVFKNDSGTTIHSYSMMPSVQYYFINNTKFHLFGHAGYGFGFEDLTRGNIENSALTLFSVGAGMNIAMFDKLALKLLVPYFNAHNITIDSNAADGIGLFVGLNYKL